MRQNRQAERQEAVAFSRVAALGGLDILHAQYITHRFGRHIHDGYAIGVIEHGVEAFTLRGGTHFGTTGSIVFVNPHEVHDGWAAEESGWRYRMLYPSVELLEQVAEDVTGKRYMPYFADAVVTDHQMNARLVHLHRTMQMQDTPLASQSVFLEAMGELVRRYGGNRMPETGEGYFHPAVARAADYLREHFAESVELDQLAAVAGMSRFHFLRSFAKLTGVPPHVYQMSLRVEHARKLLASGEPPANVAALCGFTDQSHLTRKFKQHIGVTPAVYAQKSNPVQDGLTLF